MRGPVPWSLLMILLAAAAPLPLARAVEAAAPSAASPARRPAASAPSSGLAPVPVDKQQSSHAPFLTGECVACHAADPAAKPGRSPGKLKAAPPDLCLACHDQTADMDSHKDLVTTSCVECHNPHNSTNKSLLQ